MKELHTDNNNKKKINPGQEMHKNLKEMMKKIKKIKQQTKKIKYQKKIHKTEPKTKMIKMADKARLNY